MVLAFVALPPVFDMRVSFRGDRRSLLLAERRALHHRSRSAQTAPVGGFEGPEPRLHQSPSANGRATEAGWSVTNPIQCDDSPGERMGTLMMSRVRPVMAAYRRIICS